tara:strand:+ start:394 stop:543 length:150 start_codon:yes stop_codon:yes gene_type:complete
MSIKNRVRDLEQAQLREMKRKLELMTEVRECNRLIASYEEQLNQLQATA